MLFTESDTELMKRIRNDERLDLLGDPVQDLSLFREIHNVRQRVFLIFFIKTRNVNKSCEEAGVTRQAFYIWRREDEVFHAALDRAWEIGIQCLEEEVLRRALDGIDEPIVYKGQIQTDETGKPITLKKYSDNLAMFLLKGNMPDRYKDRSETVVKGDEDLAEQLAQGRRRAQAVVARAEELKSIGSGKTDQVVEETTRAEPSTGEEPARPDDIIPRPGDGPRIP